MNVSQLPRSLLRVKSDYAFFARELRLLGRSDQGGESSIRHQEGVLCFQEIGSGVLGKPEFLAAVLTEREFVLVNVQYDMNYATIARTDAQRIRIHHAFTYWDIEAVSRGYEGVEETSAANVSLDQEKILKELGPYGPEHSVHIRVEARLRRQRTAFRLPTKKKGKGKGKDLDQSSSYTDVSSSTSRWRFRPKTPSSSSQSFESSNFSSKKTGSFKSGGKKKKKKKSKRPPRYEDLGLIVLHLLTFEEDSVLQFHLRSSWLNTKLRRALKIPTAPPQSGLEIAIRYVKGAQDTVYEEDDDLVILEILQELCEELQIDLSVKDAFFRTHTIVLMAELLEDALAVLFSEENPPSWDEVYNEMEMVSAVYCVCHAALFDCESLPSRYNLLDPAPFTFEKVLDLVLKDYTPFIPAGHLDEILQSANPSPREDTIATFSFRNFAKLSTIESSRYHISRDGNAAETAQSKIARKLMSRSGPVPVTPAGELKDPLLEPSYLSNTASFTPIRNGESKTPGTKSKMFLRYLANSSSGNLDWLTDQPDGCEVPALKMHKFLSLLGEELHDLQVVLMMQFRDLLFSASLDWHHSGFQKANVPLCLSHYFLHLDDLESWVDKLVARIVTLVDEVDDDRLITVGKTDKERPGQPVRLNAQQASAFKARKSLEVEQMSQSIGRAYRLSHFDDDDGENSRSLGSSESEDSSSDSGSEGSFSKGDALIGKKSHARRLSYQSERSSANQQKHSNKLRIDRDVLRSRQQDQMQAFKNERALSCVMLLYHASLLHYLQQDDTRMREVLACILERDIREILSSDDFLTKLMPLLSDDQEVEFFEVCDQLNILSLKLILRTVHSLVPDIQIELTA